MTTDWRLAMTTLNSIEQALRHLLKPEHASRPLLCDGSPIGCEVAIVGINPGTDIQLWPYWSTVSGCNKDAWLTTFWQNPANVRKSTRRRIEDLIEGLKPLRCLELNIYPYVSRKEAELAKELQDISVFDFLLRTIKPKLLFVFGNTPIKELQTLLNASALPKGDFTPCTYKGAQFEVYAETHLSRGWSKDRVRSLGLALKNHILTNSTHSSGLNEQHN
jgi:hypothetical protein